MQTIRIHLSRVYVDHVERPNIFMYIVMFKMQSPKILMRLDLKISILKLNQKINM